MATKTKSPLSPSGGLQVRVGHRLCAGVSQHKNSADCYIPVYAMRRMFGVNVCNEAHAHAERYRNKTQKKRAVGLACRQQTKAAALECAGIWASAIGSTPLRQHPSRGLPHDIRRRLRVALDGSPYDHTSAVGSEPNTPDSVHVAPHHVRGRFVLRGASSQDDLGGGGGRGVSHCM